MREPSVWVFFYGSYINLDVLAEVDHRELDRLYVEHAQGVLGGTYEPAAVLAETRDGRWRPALCYLAHNMDEAAPAADYVDRIARPARQLSFPDWYCERIESFAPTR